MYPNRNDANTVLNLQTGSTPGEGFENRQQQQEQEQWFDGFLSVIADHVVLDASVWIGRILCAIAIVVLSDVYQRYFNPKPKKISFVTNNSNSNSNNVNSGTRVARYETRPPLKSPSKTDETKTETTTKTITLQPADAIDLSLSQKEPNADESNKTEYRESVSAKATQSADSKDLPSKEKEPHGGETKNHQESVSDRKGSSTSTKKTATTTASATPRPFTPKTESDVHPGMGGFLHWYEVETSLYRIYTLAHKDPSIPTVPPYAPSSKRGRVALELRVTNTTNRNINVFWVNHKGKHVPRGTIPRRNGAWTQITWIDHPWVFEDALTQTPCLYYVPYRVIPTIPEAPTMGSENTGVHKFALSETNNVNDAFHINVDDEILPFPGSLHLDQPLKAILWTLLQVSRTDVSSNGWIRVEAATLQKYLVNILNHPGEWKYRNLRINGKRFAPIWASPLRGLLLAVGFREECGVCHLGRSDRPLPPDRIQDVALLSYLLTEWQHKHEGTNSGEQPVGASDGFGRDGFGRAGTIN